MYAHYSVSTRIRHLNASQYHHTPLTCTHHTHLQLLYHFLHNLLLLGACKAHNDSLHLLQQRRVTGGASNVDEEVEGNVNVLPPATQGPPQLLHLLHMVVAILEKDNEWGKHTGLLMYVEHFV